ncbi:phosphatidylethanolamine N-methyltransferase [Pyricularia oryzae]
MPDTMSATTKGGQEPVAPTNIRKRRGVQAEGDTESSTAQDGIGHAPTAQDEQSEDQEQAKLRQANKSYGRTPDGTVFTVPTTHDMVSQLLDPRQPKNLSDVIVLAILGMHILAAYALPSHLKRPVFAAIFIFWRASYNIGIGILLRVQSQHKLLVVKAKKWGIFEDPASGKNPRPWLYHLLKRELEAKIPEDYKLEEAPIEYNTWLLFRRVVDLILMCDFVSYCLFAAVCGSTPDGEAPWATVARWVMGWVLVGLNLWIKLDAHRVVKDFAWYWGDFFYLIDQELTFDGVFELAPHPMYSIGYIGYYGISMMAASYDVLFISIIAHLAQLIFLVVVENPHIEKTYNPPPPRSAGQMQPLDGAKDADSATRDSPATVHNMLGFKNIDLFRVPDYTTILLCIYLGVLSLATPKTEFWQAAFIVHAVLCRLWFSLGLGWILTFQSKEKRFTRHFVKYGESAGEAWRQWKGLYHVSTVMCHGSFIAACWKMYTVPADWTQEWSILKHVTGTGLVALQIWTAVSIYDELGEFGWFFGDFFFNNRTKLTYRSIYRFLNNPERVMGSLGLYGAALITWSRAIFVLALISHLLTLAFISYVEKPHMQKIYGQSIREEAGLTKFVKRSLPPPVKEWSDSVDKVLDEAKAFVEDFVESARPKLAAGVSTIVRDTTALFNTYPARLTISQLNPSLAGLDPKQYSLSLEGTVAQKAASGRSTGKESIHGRFPKDVKTLVLEYGAPIRVKWTAPANHSKNDWVGLYMVIDNRSREVTEVPSQGRWVPTCPGVYDRAIDGGIITADKPLPSQPDMVQGEMVFEGDRLWWTQGTFELRYHHDGSHNVMSVSEPFEIKIGRFDEDLDEEVLATGGGVYERAVESELLPLVRNCLDRDPEIAPSTVDEPFGSPVERDSKYAKRVVYAIHHMFGIEFAPAVVPADGNVRKLAWRICNAKQVLAPYSMSKSRGTTTPLGEKFLETL